MARDRSLEPSAACFVPVDNIPVYDLSTSTTKLHACNGSTCAEAAQAVDAYQDLLHDITFLSTTLLGLSFAEPMDLPWTTEGQFLNTLPRLPSCGTLFRVVERLVVAHNKFQAVMPRLRAVEPALEVSCVSAARTPEWMPFCYPNTSAFLTKYNGAKQLEHAFNVIEYQQSPGKTVPLFLCVFTMSYVKATHAPTSMMNFYVRAFRAGNRHRL